MKDLGPNETMILDADGSGKGPWIGEAKDKLYTATYQARVADAARDRGRRRLTRIRLRHCERAAIAGAHWLTSLAATTVQRHREGRTA